MSRTERSAGGTWRPLAIITEGKDAAVGRTTLLTAEGDAFTMTVNGRAFMTGTTRVVSEGPPVQSDVVVERGPNAGKTLRQISKVEGDVLIACTGPPDGERPGEFTCEPGSRRTLSLWVRVRPEDVSRYQRPDAVGNWQFLIFLFCVMAVVDYTVGLRKDLVPRLGYWGSFAAGVAVAAGVLTGVGLLFRWGWRAGLALGLSASLAVSTFVELRTTLAPTLGVAGAIAVAGATAMVVSWLSWAALGRLFKLRA